MFFLNKLKGETHVCVVIVGGRAKEERTIESVALAMNIVPCRELYFRGQRFKTVTVFNSRGCFYDVSEKTNQQTTRLKTQEQRH